MYLTTLPNSSSRLPLFISPCVLLNIFTAVARLFFSANLFNPIPPNKPPVRPIPVANTIPFSTLESFVMSCPDLIALSVSE